jgi:transposase
MHLVEQTKRKEDPDPKALACYGVLIRWRTPDAQAEERMWLRFVDGRPVSAITIQFLEGCCVKLQAIGKRVLALVWDNASWHVSQAVRRWIREHNRQVRREGQGVRILVCCLPIKSPWLNPIEPKWVHAKRRVVEPDRTLSAQELADRICVTFGCAHEEHLSIPEEVA